MSAATQLMKILKISLEVTKGPGQGQKFAFEKPTITIGRGPENDVVFSQDVKVSRQHLEFQVTMNQVILRNLSQKNALAVDGEIVVEKVLRPGASIRFGETEMKISFDKPAEPKANLMAVPSFNPSAVPAPAIGAQPPAMPKPAGGLGPVQSAGPAAVGSPYPSAPTARYSPPSSDGRLKLYIGIGLILAAAAFLSKEQLSKRKELKLRDSVSTELAISESQNQYEKTLKDMERRGQDTIQYKLAQEQYVRGFRDYRQGQYVRAMEEFQAALSFFPNHEMSRKYYILSKRKFDEQIQQNMIQGKRYYGISNYRLCMGYYSNVIKMKKDLNDPIRREAKQYYDECELKLRGKF